MTDGDDDFDSLSKEGLETFCSPVIKRFENPRFRTFTALSVCVSAIQMLKDKQPGTFVIRDSNSFPGAFGLALKVATIPPNVQAKPSGNLSRL